MRRAARKECIHVVLCQRALPRPFYEIPQRVETMPCHANASQPITARQLPFPEPWSKSKKATATPRLVAADVQVVTVAPIGATSSPMQGLVIRPGESRLFLGLVLTAANADAWNAFDRVRLNELNFRA